LRSHRVSWHRHSLRIEKSGAKLDKTELRKLQEFLRRSLGNEDVMVAPDPRTRRRRRAPRRAPDWVAGRGRRGWRPLLCFSMKVPVGREVLQSYLRKLFENDRLTVAPRGRKTDSVELNSGEDFLGLSRRTTPRPRATPCKSRYSTSISTIFDSARPLTRISMGGSTSWFSARLSARGNPAPLHSTPPVFKQIWRVSQFDVETIHAEN